MTVQVQTGNMLDVVVEGKSLGLKQRGSNDVIWLPDPAGLRDVLDAEIKRLAPTPPANTEVSSLDQRIKEAAENILTSLNKALNNTIPDELRAILDSVQLKESATEKIAGIIKRHLTK